MDYTCTTSVKGLFCEEDWLPGLILLPQDFSEPFLPVPPTASSWKAEAREI